MQHSEGGYFRAHLTFPKEYPQRPPKMKFVTDIWHPNGMYVCVFVRVMHVDAHVSDDVSDCKILI